MPVESLIPALRMALLQHAQALQATPDAARLSLSELMALHGEASIHVLLFGLVVVSLHLIGATRPATAAARA